MLGSITDLTFRTLRPKNARDSVGGTKETGEIILADGIPGMQATLQKPGFENENVNPDTKAMGVFNLEDDPKAKEGDILENIQTGARYQITGVKDVGGMGILFKVFVTADFDSEPDRGAAQ